MGSVVQGVGSIVGPLISGLFNTGASGSSPAGSLASGLLTSAGNRPPAQTQPGAYYPQSGQGVAYNYIPTGQPGADVGAQNQLAYQQGTGLTAQNLANPMLATLLRNFMNDPNMAGLQAGGNQAGAMSGAAAAPTFQAGTLLNQSILAALPQFQQILAQGTDPQGALYDRTLAQTRDQMGAQLSQQGLTGSGQGAAIENQGISNFNIDWQNQQLARALSAMQGFSGAIGQAGSGLQAGAGLQGTGISDAYNSGALPYQAGQTAMGGQQNALTNFLSGFSGSQNIGNQNLAQMLAYLQTGLGADQAANSVASGAQAQTSATNAAGAAALSPLISAGGQGLAQALAMLFGGGSGGSTVPTSFLQSGQIGSATGGQGANAGF